MDRRISTQRAVALFLLVPITGILLLQVSDLGWSIMLVLLPAIAVVFCPVEDENTRWKLLLLMYFVLTCL